MAEYKSPQSEPGTEQRFVLVFLLMAGVIFGAQFLMKKYAPTPPSSAHPNQAVQSAPVQPPVSAAATAAPHQKRAASSATAPAEQAESESEAVIENDLYRITLTNRGAQAKSWILKKYSDDQGHPLDLVNPQAAAKYGYPLSLWTYDESLRNKLNSALYVASKTGTTSAPTSLAFEYSDSGLTVRKELEFDHSYVVHVQTSVFLNGSPVSAFPAWPAGFGDQTTPYAYAQGQFEYQLNNNTEHVPAKKISNGNTLHGTFNWVGTSSAFFGAVFIPDKIDDLYVVTLHNAIDIAPDPSKPNETKPADVLGVAVGHPGETSARLFVGPKALEVLYSIPVPSIVGADKDLRNVLNFGWWGAIARPLFSWRYIGLRWFHQYTHNWGWAIVLQTLIITLALLPLRIYQMKSALKMQKLQPQMKSIQEKYKKYGMRDPRKQDMQKEIAELYKREKVNPVSGCLPLLVQMPFLIAYYKMLGAAIDLRQAHWLWIHDLSASDWILPLIMAASMFLMQRMTPQPGMDPAQQRMMTFLMPIMMGVFFFKLPAGLNLYYAESNLIMIAQQAIMNRTGLGREMREIAAKRARKRDK
ncbi:MAG: protein translocase subunit yidC [Acidobacteriaceae bacterium]|nr:protein translocase subunit yidC [Acidobacteriaceae bacterium]